ncbi:MAG: hypothetical protein HY259_05720 [Chloroflexi bacterium]|nr:hypothetical protein [Chloroflexota bacterium]
MPDGCGGRVFADAAGLHTYSHTVRQNTQADFDPIGHTAKQRNAQSHHDGQRNRHAYHGDCSLGYRYRTESDIYPDGDAPGSDGNDHTIKHTDRNRHRHHNGYAFPYANLNHYRDHDCDGYAFRHADRNRYRHRNGYAFPDAYHYRDHDRHAFRHANHRGHRNRHARAVRYGDLAATVNRKPHGDGYSDGNGGAVCYANAWRYGDRHARRNQHTNACADEHLNACQYGHADAHTHGHRVAHCDRAADANLLTDGGARNFTPRKRMRPRGG